jgi:hypothetical protein
MPDADRSTARAVTVVALVVLAAAALRGYLPGAEPVPDEPDPSGPGALIPVVAMVVLAVAVIAVAVVGRRRDPVTRPATMGELPRGAAAGGTRWTPRMLLVVVAVALLWLLVVVLLMRLGDWLPQATDPPPIPVDSPVPDPAPAGGRADPPPADPARSPSPVGYLAAAAAVLVGLSVLASLTRRRRPPAPTPAAPGAPTRPPASGTQTLARAAERGLAEIGDLSREPREAIIACYAAMERELAKSPAAMPRASDTPSEVLARAVERHLLRADSATELVDLFEEARFSPHVMGEDHREAAVRVLRLVLGELQGSGMGTA